MTNAELAALDEAKAEALNLLNELLANKLEVSLSGPIDDTGRKYRIVNGRNPAWYRVLFASSHNGKRGKKANGRIRRVRVLDALHGISIGNYYGTYTQEVLMDEIKDRLFNGYYLEEECVHVPPQLKEDS